MVCKHKYGTGWCPNFRGGAIWSVSPSDNVRLYETVGVLTLTKWYIRLILLGSRSLNGKPAAPCGSSGGNSLSSEKSKSQSLSVCFPSNEFPKPPPPAHPPLSLHRFSPHMHHLGKRVIRESRWIFLYTQERSMLGS